VECVQIQTSHGKLQDQLRFISVVDGYYYLSMSSPPSEYQFLLFINRCREATVSRPVFLKLWSAAVLGEKAL
jgi:hypothetical protein